MKRHLSTVIMAAAIASAAGCSWHAFDDIQNRTPVRVIGAPSGFPTSNDFGRVMIATAPPADGSAAARAIVSSSQETGIAVLDFDAHGQVAGQTVSNDTLTALSGFPLTTMAEVPGANGVLLGAPSPVGGKVLFMSLDAPFEVSAFSASGTDPNYGVGVAAGNLGGGAPAERVVLSATQMYVYADGTAAPAAPVVTDDGSGAAPCPIYFPSSVANKLNRAVTIANLQGGGPQIVVGTPSTVPSTSGHVSIFNADVAGGSVTCALALSGADQTFGQAIVAGDFDGDGRADLLVGAPPAHAYLFRGPITAGTTPTVITSNTGMSFGSALAAFDLDGVRGDEAFLADRDATVNGQANAGQVVINTGATLAMKLPTVLVDRNASSGEAYGSTVVGLPFCAAAGGSGPDGGADAGHDAGTDAGAGHDGGAACDVVRLPLVGSSSNVFVYYTLGAVDPRAK